MDTSSNQVRYFKIEIYESEDHFEKLLGRIFDLSFGNNDYMQQLCSLSDVKRSWLESSTDETTGEEISHRIEEKNKKIEFHCKEDELFRLIDTLNGLYDNDTLCINVIPVIDAR